MINLQELPKFYDKIGYAPHEHIQDFFHQDVFEDLRTNFPSNNLFGDELPERRKQNQRPHHRRLMCVYEGSDAFFDHYKVDINRLPNIWQQIITLFSDNNGKYQDWLKRILEIKDFTIRFDFHRTKSGLDVSPHVDTASKIGSHLFYFMPDGWQEAYGGTTIFYKNKLVSQGNPEPADFAESKTYPVIGNYSLLFKNAKDGWHGVKPITNNAGLHRQIFSVVIHEKK